MSIRRAHREAQTQDAAGLLHYDQTPAGTDSTVTDRGSARLGSDQKQLDYDGEFADPTDLGNAARRQRRQRDLDGCQGRPKDAEFGLSPGASATTAVLDARPRVVVADDDPVVRSMLEMSLRGAFNVVGLAADSEDAIELIRLHQPDAAVIDVEMPKGGGLAAVRGIMDVAPSTAIVVLSSDESDPVVRELIQAGAMAYLRKGSAPQVLSDSLTDSIKAHTERARCAPAVATPR
jgi:CheY-like chemotaxis protein